MTSTLLSALNGKCPLLLRQRI